MQQLGSVLRSFLGLRRVRSVRGIALCLTGLCLTGCGEHITVVPVMQHDQCGALNAGITLIDYAQLAKIRGVTLLDMTQSEPDADGSLTLVAISKGQQTTAGFDLSVMDDAALEEMAVTIPVTWTEPASEAIVPQTLTHPCVIVGLPPGKYTLIRAIDQYGNEIGRVATL